MELPLCKICGARHRLGSCPKFEGVEADQRRQWFKGMVSGQTNQSRAVETPEESPAVVAQDQGHPPGQLEGIEAGQLSAPIGGDNEEEQGRRKEAVEGADENTATEEIQQPPLPAVGTAGKPKFDRTAYQRELMRKRRAAGKK